MRSSALVGMGVLCAFVLTVHDVVAQTSTGLPTGFTCGLGYLSYEHGTCELVSTGYCEAFGNPAADSVSRGATCSAIPGAGSGFSNSFDGDQTEPSGLGYYHQTWTGSNGTASDQYLLPSGTACGFKEKCHDGGEKCMNHDPAAAVSPCPWGWVQKLAYDIGAPSGCNFYWCEYQDPKHLCTTSACYDSEQPSGLVCGISDNRRTGSAAGQCMGQVPSLSTCNALGYGFFPFEDDGAPSGEGLGFCMKGP